MKVMKDFKRLYRELKELQSLIDYMEVVNKDYIFTQKDIDKYWITKAKILKLLPILKRFLPIRQLNLILQLPASESGLEEIFDLYRDKEKKHLKSIDRILHPSKMKSNSNSYITQEDIDEARSHDISEVVESYGIEVNKGTLKCPFHKEKTASCKLYYTTNSYFCFGCSEGGDVIDFIMKMENYTFPNAVLKLI